MIAYKARKETVRKERKNKAHRKEFYTNKDKKVAIGQIHKNDA